MDAKDLLNCCMASAELHHKVMAYLETVDDEQHAVATIQDLPVDIGTDIFQRLTFDDQMAIALTSASFMSLMSSNLFTACEALTSSFGLSFKGVRMMQTATGTAIAGSSTVSLMRLSGFTPGDIDFYAPAERGRFVVSFMERFGYSVTNKDTQYFTVRGIKQIWILHNAAKQMINVIECRSANPIHTIVTFHSTAVMSALLPGGLWHAYPSLTLSQFNMTTRDRFPFPKSLAKEQKTWGILRKYRDRGFMWCFGGLPDPHVCGRDKNCPATLRLSDDSECMFLRLPAWKFTMQELVQPRTCWTLLGEGCKMGVLNTVGGVQTVGAENDTVRLTL
ncbi:hypothetical protein R3P38DRAFT_2776741 [Favolaschia claudopus]|uniref:F-box domain-containing protein n=1 Tax=Favolaschia claudopus TaxID=2862362 RepID=A0AAW0BMT7_9AGAR